ncbi:MAG: hypothetical protein SGBAC_003713 [Bacillariaceae sp.]
MGKKKRPQRTKGRKRKSHHHRQSQKVSNSSDEGESFEVDDLSSDDGDALISSEETPSDCNVQQGTSEAEEPKVDTAETETADDDTEVETTSETRETLPETIPEVSEENETPVLEVDGPTEKPQTAAETSYESTEENETPEAEEDGPVEKPEDTEDGIADEESKPAEEPTNLFENIGRFFQKPRESKAEETESTVPESDAPPKLSENVETTGQSEEHNEVSETNGNQEAEAPKLAADTTEALATEEPKNLLANIGLFFQSKPQESADKGETDVTKLDEPDVEAIETESKPEVNPDEPASTEECDHVTETSTTTEEPNTVLSNLGRFFQKPEESANKETQGVTESDGKESEAKETEDNPTEATKEDETGIAKIDKPDAEAEETESKPEVNPDETFTTEECDPATETSVTTEEPNNMLANLGRFFQKPEESANKETKGVTESDGKESEAKETEDNPTEAGEDEEAEPATTTSATTEEPKNLLQNIGILFQRPDEAADIEMKDSIKNDDVDNGTKDQAIENKPEESETFDKTPDKDVAQQKDGKREEKGGDLISSFKGLFGSENGSTATKASAADVAVAVKSDMDKREPKELAEEDARPVAPESNVEEKPSTTTSNKEAPAPRESAIISNFKKLFAGQDASEQGVADNDPRVENSDKAVDGGEPSTEVDSTDGPIAEMTKSTEEAATATKSVDSATDTEKNPDGEVVKALRKTSIVSNFKNVFEGQEAPKENDSAVDSKEQRNEPTTCDNRKQSAGEMKGGEKADSESDPGVKAVRKMSKVSSVKHLFESPKPGKASVTSKIVSSSAATGVNSRKSATDINDNSKSVAKSDLSVKAVRKVSKVASVKHLFESPTPEKGYVASKLVMSPATTGINRKQSAREMKGDEKADPENDPGVKAVRKMSKVSSVKHLFESPKPERASVASRIVISPATTGMNRNGDEKLHAKNADETKTVRKMSKVLSIKHLFEGNDVCTQDDIVVESSATTALRAGGEESSKVNDAAEQSQAEKSLSTEDRPTDDHLSESDTAINEDDKPKTGNSKEAAAPRESAIVKNFKMFFGSEDTAEQEDNAEDPMEEIADREDLSNADDIMDESTEEMVQLVEEPSISGNNIESVTEIGQQKPDDDEIKSLRKSSIVSNLKNIFEGQNVPDQDDVAVDSDEKDNVSTGASKLTVNQPDEANEEIKDAAVDDQAVTIGGNGDKECDAENNTEAPAPRESALIKNFKTFFGAQDISEQDDTALDCKEEPNDEMVGAGVSSNGDDAVDTSECRSKEGSSTDGGMTRSADNEEQAEAAAPRDSLVVSGFKILFGGQADDDNSRPREHDDDLSALIDKLDANKSMDKEETKGFEEKEVDAIPPAASSQVQQLRGAVTTVMAANMLQDTDKEKAPPSGALQLRGAVTTVMAANMLQDEDKEPPPAPSGAAQLRGAVATVMAANMLQDSDKEKAPPTGATQLRGAVTTVMAANMLLDEDKEPPPSSSGAAQLRGAVTTVMAANMLQSEDKEPPSPTQKLRGAVTTVMASNSLAPDTEEGNVESTDANEATFDHSTPSEDSGLFSNMKRFSQRLLTPSPATQTRTLELEKQEKLRLLAEHLSLDENEIMDAAATQDTMIKDSIFERNVRFLDPEIEEDDAAESDSDSVTSSDASDSDSEDEEYTAEEMYDQLEKANNQNMEMKEVLDALEESHRAIEVLQEENKRLEEASLVMQLNLEEEVDTNQVLEQQIARGAAISNQSGKSEESAKLMEQLIARKAENEVLQAKVASLESQQAALSKTLQEATSAAKSQDETVGEESLSVAIQELRVELHDLYDQNENLVCQLSEAQRKASGSNATTETFGTLTVLSDEFLRVPQVESRDLPTNSGTEKLTLTIQELRVELHDLYDQNENLVSQLSEKQQKESDSKATIEPFGTSTKLSDEFLRVSPVGSTDLVETDDAKQEALQTLSIAMQSQMQEENNNLMEQLAALKVENEALQAAVISLESQQAALSETLQEELAAAKTQNEKLKSKAYETESKQLEESKKLSKVVEEKEKEILRLQNEVTDLNEVKVAMNQPPPRAANRRPSEFELTALQVQKNRASSEKEKLEDDLILIQDEKDELEATVESLECEKRKLEKHSTSLKEQNDELSQKVDSLEAALSDAEERIEQLGAMSKQHSEESAELAEKILELEGSLTEAEAEKSSFAAKISSLEEEKTALQNTVDSKTSEKETLETIIEDLNAQSNAKTEENKALAEKIKENKESADTLETELSVAKKKIEELGALSEQQSVESTERAANVSELEVSLAELKEETSSLADKVSSLEEEKTTLQSAVDLMTSDNETVEKTVADLMAQSNVKTEEITALEEKLKETEASHSAEKKGLEATIAEMKDLTEAQQEENKALHDHLEQASKTEVELASVKKADEEKAKKILKLQNEFDQESSEKATLQKKCNGLVAERDGLKASLERKEKELKVARVGNKENTKGKAAAVPNAEPTVPKKSRQVNSNTRSAPAPTKKTEAKKEQQITKKQPIASSPGMTPEDDTPVQEFLKFKKRGYIKRSLNNKYEISTEDKIEQRKLRKKSRKNFKGMKQFFLGGTTSK